MSAGRLQSLLGAWIIVLTAVFYAFPAYGMYSWAAMGLSAAAAVLVGIRVHRPARRLPWYLLSAVLASCTLGDTTYNVLTDFLGQRSPFPSLADVCYLIAYPMLAAALLVFIRARSGADNRAALIDALVPTVGVGLLSWVVLIAPYVQNASLGLGEKLVSVAYPLGDVLALAMLFRLLTAGGRKPMALSILSGGVLSLLVTDVIYGLRQLDGSWQVGGPVDVGWMLFYTAIGISALHPSMRRLTMSGDATARVVPGGRRMAGMSLAALIAPATLVIDDLRGGVSNALMIAMASSVVFLLVMARVAGLVQQQRATAARERVLHLTGTALVAASSEAEAVVAVRNAIAELVPKGTPHCFHAHWFDAAPDAPVGRLVTGRVAVADLPAAAAAHLGEFASALFGESVSGVRQGSGQAKYRGVAYLAAADEVLIMLQSSFEALMTQGTLAVERITLTADINRRSSQDYFKALIQNTSDVILIVDDETNIRYASPSASAVFGRTDLTSTSLYGLVAPTDHAELRDLLGHVRGGRGHDRVDLTAISGNDLLQVEFSCSDLRDDPAVAALVITIQDVTERRRLENDLVHQAYHDSLTGLANRALYQRRLEQAASRAAAGEAEAPVAAIFVDLDDFKEVNDSLGHAAGDQLLVDAGRRIAEIAGPSNLCARTGGDEFAILMEHARAAEDADQVAARIVEALTRPAEVTDGAGRRHAVVATASVGVAVGVEAADVTELLRRADVAMYVAKTNGKNTWRGYHDDLHDAMMNRLEMRSALNEAAPGDQMRLRYQPIVDLPTAEMIGLEALVRWQHPTRGLLGPNEFIELAEETGSVVAIGEWVLREALRSFARWRRDSPDSPLRYLSVNVSPRQFRTPGFVSQVRAVLTDSGAQPDWLLLEITESLVLHDADQVWRDLRELRTMGVRIAIDDFGTGYSSLSYLSKMPVDVLKIDKSFIDDILHNAQQLALVETIMNLARTLNLAVVAEGIELEEHRQALLDMGCPYGQGYLFSKPVTADDIDHRLNASERPSMSKASPGL